MIETLILKLISTESILENGASYSHFDWLIPYQWYANCQQLGDPIWVQGGNTRKSEHTYKQLTCRNLLILGDRGGISNGASSKSFSLYTSKNGKGRVSKSSFHEVYQSSKLNHRLWFIGHQEALRLGVFSETFWQKV